MASAVYEELLAKLTGPMPSVGIIGLGYVGLPLAKLFLQQGFHVYGFDVDANKTAQLHRGQAYIRHVDASSFPAAIAEGRFTATVDMHRLCEPDALVMCVPTPLTTSRDPDLQFVESTTKSIASRLRPGQLVVLESTTYPGTTRGVVLPMLQTSGLAASREFFLAYSPEREDPGNAAYATQTIPKVVGGIDELSLSLAAALYGRIVAQVVPVSSCEVAEASKIVENTYRCVNIAMVNELKCLFDRLDLDLWEVLDAASTKPFGFHPFYPGPGLGGHCIPIDPFYLSWLARNHQTTTRFIELAGEINTAMPRWVVDKVVDALNRFGKPVQGSSILILGVAYKRDVDDVRESPAFELLELLHRRGASLSYNDPLIPALPRVRKHDWSHLRSQDLDPAFLASQDCVVICTDHSCYDWDFLAAHAALVVDTRNAMNGARAGRATVVKA